MRADIRQHIRVLYEYRCGYCGVRESDAGARLTLDHFRPRSIGGNDEIDNLVYCCHKCNEFKGDYWHEEEEQRLLHPYILALERIRVEMEAHSVNFYIELLMTPIRERYSSLLQKALRLEATQRKSVITVLSAVRPVLERNIA